MFTEFDSYLFHEGTLYDAYKKMGAHPCRENGQNGVRFCVWAEHAKNVSVAIFDAFTGEKNVPMSNTEHGVWEVFVPDINKGTCYKYLIEGADGVRRYKSDPYAFYSELRPANGSVVWGLNEYNWTDAEYMARLRPGIHDDSLQMTILEHLPAETAEKICEIQNREAGYLYKKQMDDARWLVTERIMKERRVEEDRLATQPGKASKNDFSDVSDADLAAAIKNIMPYQNTNSFDINGFHSNAADTILNDNVSDSEEHESEPAHSMTPEERDAAVRKVWDAAWKAKIEAQIKDAQKDIKYIPPRSYHELSSEYKNILVNRACAELSRERPMSIYEIHLGSWKKDYSLNADGFLNYRDLADQLADYVSYMGFTHVEVMGICEYPFDGSWGYQVTGYFSPTSRHGNPDDLKYFIDKMHSVGIGVIIDWVPAHFPKDAFGLINFDGSPSYESSDPLLAEYPEWGTMAFDHARPEVRSFLISSAFYWVQEFHADALRVDAVAAMIYTNFSRQEWRPNKYGGSLNLDSIDFMKQLNKEVVDRTGAFLIAEDSSAEQGITKQVYEGGLGFMYKWNMGWMNDTLGYYKKDPIYRSYHFGQLTHTLDYVFSEYFVNVLSHDEVVHLKKPMLYKMPGAIPDKLSGLKNLYTYQFTHPGKKLLFMGQEFAEDREWDENRIINWAYTNETWHRDVLLCVKRLLEIYKEFPALYKDTDNEKALEWVNRNDKDRGIMAYIRKNPENYDGALLIILNTTPVQYNGYSCGIPTPGYHQCIFSTYDSTPDTGTPSYDNPPLTAVKDKCDGFEYRLTYDLRPNEAVIIRV